MRLERRHPAARLTLQTILTVPSRAPSYACGMPEQWCEPRACLSYSIDHENRLQTVDDRWLAFACANSAPELTPAAVLGRPIAGFIADPTTRYLYGLLYERVRRGATLRLSFRCDAPEVRRDMVLQLSSAGSGAVQCHTFLLDEQPHSSIALLDAASPRGTDFVVMCSWCKRIRHQGQWLDVEEGVQELQLFSRPVLPEISHGVCPSCTAAFYAPATVPTEQSAPQPKLH